MSKRFWFYSASLIVMAGLLVWLLALRNQLRNEQQRQQTLFAAEQQALLSNYLSSQDDERKLVTLAKTYAKTQPELVRPVIERAYELNPNSRDIVILASHYHPELKEKIKFLDPLYATD